MLLNNSSLAIQSWHLDCVAVVHKTHLPWGAQHGHPPLLSQRGLHYQKG